jgi:hypothetical protein
MSRPKTEHGKRVTIAVKVSEPKALAVDERRGELTRAAYLESLIDADLNGFTGKPEPAPKKPRGVPLADEVALNLPSAPADQVPRRSQRPVTRSHPAPHRCPTKGWCGTCNEWKGKR